MNTAIFKEKITPFIVCFLIAILSFLLLINVINKTPYFLEMVFSAVCFIASIFILYKCSHVKGKIIISPAIAFAFMYIVFIYIGSIIHFFQSQNITYTISYPFEKYNYNLLILTNLGFLFLAIGVFIANKYFSFNHKTEVSKFYESKIIQDMPRLITNPVFHACVLLCLACGIIAIISAKTIPIIHNILHPGNFLEVMNLRNHFSSTPGIGVLQFFYIRIFGFLSLIVLLTCAIDKSIKNKMVLLFIMPPLLFYLVMSTHRSYILEYIWLVVILFLYKGVDLKSNNLLKYLGISLLFFVSITALKYNVNLFDITGILYILYLTVIRFFFAQMLPLAFMTEAFPARFDFLWGQSFIDDLSVFLPGVQITFTMWVSKQLTSYIDDIGSAPTTVFGELYVNFSMYGALIGIFILGFLIQYLYIKFIRSKRTISNICLLTFFTFAISYMNIMGFFFGFILRLLPVIICFFIIRRIYRYFTS